MKQRMQRLTVAAALIWGVAHSAPAQESAPAMKHQPAPPAPTGATSAPAAPMPPPAPPPRLAESTPRGAPPEAVVQANRQARRIEDQLTEQRHAIVSVATQAARDQQEVRDLHAGAAAILAQIEPPELPNVPRLPMHSTGGHSLGVGGMSGFGMGTGGFGIGGYGHGTVAAGVWPGARGRGQIEPLWIGCDEPEAAQRTALTEDLNIMYRLLSKAVAGLDSRPRSRTVLGIDLHTPFGSRATPCLYLEGFGVVFLFNVDFPLLASPEPNETQTPTDQPQDQSRAAWDEARREIYGPEPGTRDGADPFRSQDRAMGSSSARRNAEAKFDPERVAGLRRSLIETARYAANIRQLPATDQIVIVVQGPARDATVEALVFGTPEDVTVTESIQVIESGRTVVRSANVRRGEPQQTLVLRFTKAAADAFAKGTLSIEAFTEQTTTATY